MRSSVAGKRRKLNSPTVYTGDLGKLLLKSAGQRNDACDLVLATLHDGMAQVSVPQMYLYKPASFMGCSCVLCMYAFCPADVVVVSLLLLTAACYGLPSCDSEASHGQGVAPHGWCTSLCSSPIEDVMKMAV